VRDKKAVWTVENLPFGDYAIKFYHDENGDNACNTNFLGIPSEGYGFSNNAKAFFGLPSFDKAKFTFDSTGMVVMIRPD
jgi:uncharacterized protein (DUF2141 family)